MNRLRGMLFLELIKAEEIEEGFRYLEIIKTA